MENIIQLRHPAGKKAVRMPGEKYEAVKGVLMSHLKAKGGATHKEILTATVEDFRRRKTPFKGSIEWHMEWVKLDLEARKVIKRVNNQFHLSSNA
jgi:hypothetical protein